MQNQKVITAVWNKEGPFCCRTRKLLLLYGTKKVPSVAELEGYFFASLQIRVKGVVASACSCRIRFDTLLDGPH